MFAVPIYEVASQGGEMSYRDKNDRTPEEQERHLQENYRLGFFIAGLLIGMFAVWGACK
jgi:hypothetical protein